MSDNMAAAFAKKKKVRAGVAEMFRDTDMEVKDTSAEDKAEDKAESMAAQFKKKKKSK